MPPQAILVIIVSVLLAFAWLASEFEPYRWLRILLGTLTLSMGVLLAFAFSVIQRFTYNSSYGFSTGELIDTVVVEIDEGRTESLLPRLRTLRREFEPTYENRAHYDELVEKFVKDVKANRESAGNP